MENEEERRYKILFVTPELILNLLTFTGFKRGDCTIRYEFKTEDLPKGIIVKAVHYREAFFCFGITLYHSTWPIVPLGEPLPYIEDAGLEIFRYTHETYIEPILEVKSWRDFPAQF